MKEINEIKKIAIAGAGTMGSGIAQLSAAAEYQTVLYDVSDAAVKRGFATVRGNLNVAREKRKISEAEIEKILSRITLSHDIDEVVADVIIEAVVEKLDVKSALFQKLESLNDEDTIFCTNTSSIPVTSLSELIANPARMVGMHFFNPAHLLKLVEVVKGKFTSEEFAETIYQLAIAFGKEPVMVKDSPGFLVNRIGKLYHTESLKILEEEAASLEVIDSLLESCGFKMGPFRLIDLIGVDANLNVTRSLYDLFGRHPKFKPSGIQEELVKAGFLGKKSGKGFYQY